MSDGRSTALAAPLADWRRHFFLLLGIGAFLLVYLAPPFPDAVDPAGETVALTRAGQAALGLFLLAAVWWVSEAVPIAATSLAIGVVQALFYIRPAKDAFRDFMDPAVLFIFGSMAIGAAFTKSGLTRRLAYAVLARTGERTDMILLAALGITAGLTLVMAHTAAAATVFPILLAIYALYGEGDKRTRFGKALFIGMAYAAGAGSIVTMLGSARAPAAAGLFAEFTGGQVDFFELTLYMLPVGAVMVLLIWGYLMVFLRPEKPLIPGLGEQARALAQALGPVTRDEKLVIAIVALTVAAMGAQSLVPEMRQMDRAAIMLISTIVFFALRVLTVKELEEIPWNIILLFSGAMSIGHCLWQTGAAQWLAVYWLAAFHEAHWLVFVLSIAAFVLVMTNFIMNVAAIAISLPVSLVIAGYLNVAPEAVLYASLVAAGMPFLLLIGAAPNAIAYESKMFTPGEFFRHGLLLSLLLLIVIAAALTLVWPMLGMPILTP